MDSAKLSPELVRSIEINHYYLQNQVRTASIIKKLLPLAHGSNTQLLPEKTITETLESVRVVTEKKM